MVAALEACDQDDWEGEPDDEDTLGDPPHSLVYYARGAIEQHTESGETEAAAQAQIEARRLAFGVKNDIH